MYESVFATSLIHRKLICLNFKVKSNYSSVHTECEYLVFPIYQFGWYQVFGCLWEKLDWQLKWKLNNFGFKMSDLGLSSCTARFHYETLRYTLDFESKLGLLSAVFSRARLVVFPHTVLVILISFIVIRYWFHQTCGICFQWTHNKKKYETTIPLYL